jgi:hypothetical protein
LFSTFYIFYTAEAAEEKPAAPTPTITTALKGTRIKFEEISLVNVGVSIFYTLKYFTVLQF